MADRSSLYQSLCTFDALSVFVLSLLLIATVFAPFPVLYYIFQKRQRRQPFGHRHVMQKEGLEPSWYHYHTDCKSRIGCFLISMALLFIPVYTYEPVMKNVPNAVILLIGVLAVVIIIVLAPVESINKPLDEEERKYYARVTHCITALQVCVLIILFCLDLQDYFYAGYVSIVLIAVFMVMGKIAVKRYVQ